MSQINHISSAYSDDGGQMRPRRPTEDLGRNNFGQRVDVTEEMDLVPSVHANISDHRVRHQERPNDDEDAIYEMPEENEHGSSPPGSLSNQDIMSENIESRIEIHKFKKPKFAQSVFPDQLSEDISRQAHESQAQKALPAEARVSARVELVETSRSIQTFKMTYDRLFKKFQERLVHEYSNMRGGYMSEYQLNYDQNSSRRDNRLVEMNMSIHAQDEYTKELDKVQEQQQSCLNRFFAQKSNLFRIKTVWKAWRFYFAIYKQKARRAAYTRNTLYRKKMNRLFSSWRGVTHREFQTRMETEKTTFRTEIEGKILIQWSSKVDALMLYVAELEDKIKQEQEAREKLALMYEQSLNVGYSRLTSETAQLAQNPLVHEVTIDKCTVQESPAAAQVRRQLEQLRIQQHAQRISQQERSMHESQRSQGEQQQPLDRMTMVYRQQVHQEQAFLDAQAAVVAQSVEPLHVMSNHEVSGVQNWYDLNETDCLTQYKNDFEIDADFSVTKSSVLKLYDTQMFQLRSLVPGSARNYQVVHQVTLSSLKVGSPTIYEKFVFNDGADSINHFLKALLSQYKRRQWDRSVVDLRLVSPVVSKTMLLMEELQNELVSGYSERELLLKRFIFKHEGCVYVYTSSVPDEIHSDDESGRDDATRYTLVYQIMVFKKVGNDLQLERIKQVDFRSAHSDRLMDSYLQSLPVAAAYWQQDLTEKVAEEVLKN